MINYVAAHVHKSLERCNMVEIIKSWDYNKLYGYHKVITIYKRYSYMKKCNIESQFQQMFKH